VNSNASYIEELKDKGKIKLIPLKQWYCDSCGEIIDGVENG
jgi:methionyl-tRNA synthetase